MSAECGRATLLLLVAGACFGAAVVAPRSVRAHALAPSLLSVAEMPEGAIEVLWRTPAEGQGGVRLRPSLPPGCVATGESQLTLEAARRTERIRLRCASPTLVGATLGVEGLAESGTNVLLRVVLPDGRRLASLLSARDPVYVVPARTAAGAALRRFVGMGATHLAGGCDHLLFVTGLVCLVRGGRRLLGSVTAFTAGHSVTLGLAALGVVRLPGALVELGIATSLVALAAEIVRARSGRAPGVLAQRPWGMAFGFGLLHGLGFAGALSEAGLPAAEVPLALFGFNLGIEIAQLGLVAILLTGAAALRPLPRRWQALVPRLAAETIGVAGVFLVLQRASAALGL